jgi:hypothetical protein
MNKADKMCELLGIYYDSEDLKEIPQEQVNFTLEAKIQSTDSYSRILYAYKAYFSEFQKEMTIDSDKDDLLARINEFIPNFYINDAKNLTEAETFEITAKTNIGEIVYSGIYNIPATNSGYYVILPSPSNSITIVPLIVSGYLKSINTLPKEFTLNIHVKRNTSKIFRQNYSDYARAKNLGTRIHSELAPKKLFEAIGNPNVEIRTYLTKKGIRKSHYPRFEGLLKQLIWKNNKINALFLIECLYGTKLNINVNTEKLYSVLESLAYTDLGLTDATKMIEVYKYLKTITNTTPKQEVVVKLKDFGVKPKTTLKRWLVPRQPKNNVEQKTAGIAVATEVNERVT